MKPTELILLLLNTAVLVDCSGVKTRARLFAEDLDDEVKLSAKEARYLNMLLEKRSLKDEESGLKGGHSDFWTLPVVTESEFSGWDQVIREPGEKADLSSTPTTATGSTSSIEFDKDEDEEEQEEEKEESESEDEVDNLENNENVSSSSSSRFTSTDSRPNSIRKSIFNYFSRQQQQQQQQNDQNVRLFNVYHERILSKVFHFNRESNFPRVNETEYLLTGRLVSFFGKDDRKSVYNEMLEDMKDPGFRKFLLDVQGRKQSSDRYFRPSSIKFTAKAFVSGLIGRGSTLAFEDNYKIGEFYKHTIFTQRDYVYHRGLNRLAALFAAEFDPKVSDGLFFQFVSKAYSGVYGPSRCDLPFITRIENIPVENATKAVRRYFLDPANLESVLNQYDKDLLGYRPLLPVPKTLDDVLDATEMILQAYHSRNAKDTFKPFIKQHAHVLRNVEHLQNFYLDIAPIDQVIELFELIPNGPYQNHFAAFLYAAFIEHARHNHSFNLPRIKENFGKMIRMKLNLGLFEQIHQKSVEVAEYKKDE